MMEPHSLGIASEKCIDCPTGRRQAENSNLVTGSSSPVPSDRSSPQLVIDREEQALARDFFQRFQKADEADEEYARNLQPLAERAFRGRSPNMIDNWVTVQFKHGVRPSALAEKLCEAKTNSLDQLVKLATKKRQETAKLVNCSILVPCLPASCS
ncbi:RNA directed DNA polymerase [Echinococcus multilocularis]|uniref:RNA directed DNA polymerase n=1 Tax=Echinococcus multilocularis TaxID=6211 RepID=A0A0S4MID3_ECHMU|nr:RNA directed DNA polymerase [Echinococcus multilocularis]